jgi:hypothetical protein
MTAPFNVGLMLLLTDGSVLAQNSGTPLWWRLRPDRAGRYSLGEWRQTAPSSSAPLYFASAVMRDGTVFIAGGEYSNNGSQPSDLCTAERYDPVAEVWSDLPTPPGWTAIGDAPCCVLEDGRLLLGNIKAGPCAIWDPASADWTATGAKLNNTSSEETWTLLPDGSVLTADCVGEPNSERFFGKAWIANGATPNPLVEVESLEIGPAILLPDGTVFALGATGKTSRFTPNADPAQPGVWAAGPDVPQTSAGAVLGAKDAPACLLPNGRVLAAVGPVDGRKDSYLGPTTFFEFDPVANTWSPPLASPDQGGLAPYSYNFLLLPTGQVLVSNGGSTVQIYQPDGAPDARWAPAVQTGLASIQAGSTFRLQGTQLNGLSQACAYGDDASMATNYPIVRLRAAPPSDTVAYCRTFDHSTMGVATGRSLQETRVSVPNGLTPGVYFLSVVANGVASAEWAVTVTAARRTRRTLLQPAGSDVDGQVFGEEELFFRDLSEVHLLIDFISGRADKSLAGLKDVADRDVQGQPVQSMSPQEAVEEICKITYPPEGNLEATAQQAAFMLMVKDRLNYLAAPARGLTVAFTSMVSGVALSYRPAPLNLPLPPGLLSARQAARARAQALARGAPLSERPIIAPRFSATNAYPNLEDQARRFRRVYVMLPWLALAVVAFIVLANWDISVTSAVLNRITAAELVIHPTKPGATQIDCDLAKTPNPPPACEDLAAARANLRDMMEHGLIFRPLALSVQMLGVLDDQPSEARAGQKAAPAPGAAVQPTRLETITTDAISALNSIVIPTAFGLLGTLIGLMRSITAKLRESVLAPRDRMIVMISMCLGMSAGLAVGLFFSTDAAGNAAKAVGATITISAAGLSFLAGFGAEAFFTFLDGVLTRLMPANPSGGGVTR